MDLQGMFVSMLENRTKVLSYLAAPIIIIIATSIFAPDKLTNIITNFPHASWIDKSLSLIDAGLYIWALGGFFLTVSTILWIIIRFILPFRPLSSFYWTSSLKRGAGYLVESSSWWFALYAFRIIYENKPTHIIDVISQNQLLTAPAILFWGWHLWVYLFADRMYSDDEYDTPRVAPEVNTDRSPRPPKR